MFSEKNMLFIVTKLHTKKEKILTRWKKPLRNKEWMQLWSKKDWEIEADQNHFSLSKTKEKDKWLMKMLKSKTELSPESEIYQEADQKDTDVQWADKKSEARKQ